MNIVIVRDSNYFIETSLLGVKEMDFFEEPLTSSGEISLSISSAGESMVKTDPVDR